MPMMLTRKSQAGLTGMTCRQAVLARRTGQAVRQRPLGRPQHLQPRLQVRSFRLPSAAGSCGLIFPDTQADCAAALAESAGVAGAWLRYQDAVAQTLRTEAVRVVELESANAALQQNLQQALERLAAAQGDQLAGEVQYLHEIAIRSICLGPQELLWGSQSLPRAA